MIILIDISVLFVLATPRERLALLSVSLSDDPYLHVSCLFDSLPDCLTRSLRIYLEPDVYIDLPNVLGKVAKYRRNPLVLESISSASSFLEVLLLSVSS
jgi:hypothetical protein